MKLRMTACWQQWQARNIQHGLSLGWSSSLQNCNWVKWAHAFLSDNGDLDMLQHMPDTFCMTAIVNSSAAELSVGLHLTIQWETVWWPKGASMPHSCCWTLENLCRGARPAPQRNPSRKNVLKASIRGFQMLEWLTLDLSGLTALINLTA